MPTKRKMYATIAYIDSHTRRDDVSFKVSPKYDNDDQMWQYVNDVVTHANDNAIQLVDITVLVEGGEQLWNWRRTQPL